MTFNSIQFLVFLPTTLALFWAISGRRHRNVILLVASYVFYGYWDWRFLGLIMVSTLVDYVVAQRVAATETDRGRTRWLLVSLVVNLGILGYFKYAGFFVDSALRFVDAIGFTANETMFRVLLPVGISFYTFQTISYTMDVYRRRIEPERSLLTFAVYVAFFPQLVAGPIERAQHLLPQLQRPAVAPDRERVRSALVLILSGLFKKVVIADLLAPVANAAFDHPDQQGSAMLLVGAFAFSLQIYGDFAGYSSIARGTSRLFGVELIRNFEQPYLSTNITQFWRTWHISLSNWLHDYLYIPLGGNRGTRWETARNLMLTMLLGGLWHGASWHFVVWGGLHGLALAVHRFLGAYEPRGLPPPPRWKDLPRIIPTFVFVTLLWIAFRASSFADATDYVRGLGEWRAPIVERPDFWRSDVLLVASLYAAALAMDLVDRSRARIDPLRTWGPVRWGLVVGAMLVAIAVSSGGKTEPFIYFQF